MIMWLQPVTEYYPLDFLCLLLYLISSSIAQSTTSSSRWAMSAENSGLCATTTTTNMTNAHHPLADLDRFFHTPWIDEAFCEYPLDIHARTERNTEDCMLGNDSSMYRSLHLPFCSEYSVARVYGGLDECVMRGDRDECRQCMTNIGQIDQHVKFVYCHFAHDIMARFDCVNPFSVRWNCTHCQEAYKQWLCSMMIPFRMGEYLIEPCRTFCTMVEQRCPYLTPDDRVVYAGEPMFFCKDPDIPEIYSAYADPPHCYQPCHLNPQLQPAEACDHHELLVEELAIYHNMTRRKSSSSSRLLLSPLVVIFLAVFNF